MKIIISFCFLIILSGCVSNQQEGRKPVSYNSGSYLKESAAKNKKIVEAEEKAILELIESQEELEYKNSPDGFWYAVNEHADENGKGYPEKGDLVVFEYDLLHLNGDTIYSKEEIGVREYYIDEEFVFSGLRQGLKLMQEGETATFFFPSFKAFGYYGDLNRIGSNVPLKSTITLQSITKNKKSIN